MLSLLAVFTGLLAATQAAVPSDWEQKINSYNGFFADDDTGPLLPNGYPGIYLPLIGNGYLSHEKGVRSDTNFLSGVFNNETTSPSHRAKIPAQYNVQIENSITTGVLNDIETGTYVRRGLLNDSSTYELKWYAHRRYRSLYVLELKVNVASGLSSTSVTLVRDSSSTNFDDLSRDPTIISTFEPEIVGVGCGNTTIPETPGGATPTVCAAMGGYYLPSGTYTFAAADSGKTKTFITAFRSSLDIQEGENLITVTTNDYLFGRSLEQSGKLYSEHVDAWSELWQSGIEIEGRPDVAAAINASLYAILSSVRDDWAYGLAPGGLTNYYNGHSFWDTETWMYPPLLFLHPKISQSLITYRFNRLDGARQKAASYDPPFSGTMFPWESAFSGVETCPIWAATGQREDHISGDIAFAVWQEWCMREDTEWLRTVGYPILEGVADFWVSRVTYDTDENNHMVAHINNIIPPDEYVDHVNDSVYSNFVASQALRYAVLAADILNVSCVQCQIYAQVADDLVILFDEVNGIHPEYTNYPGNTVKQADVVLLHYPLGMEMTATERRADLEYYSSRTDHNGPAMTWGMHAIGYLDLQDFTSAAKYFNMSFQDNLHKPLQVWTETPDGNACNFITGAGGFLQTVTAGYPGLRIEYKTLSFTPICPESASYVKVRGFSYKGHVLDYEYWCDASSATPMYPYNAAITVKSSSMKSSNLRVVGEDKKEIALVVGKKITFTLRPRKLGETPAKFVLKH